MINSSVSFLSSPRQRMPAHQTPMPQRPLGGVWLRGLFALLFLSCSSGLLATDLPRAAYLGSTNIRLPTGYTISSTEYISNDNQSAICYSQKLMGKFLEVSALKYFSGSIKDKMTFNLKVNVLEEDQYLPNVVCGLSDLTNQRGGKFPFVAASKKIETFDATLHGGYLKDPAKKKATPFYGLEKTILPLISVAGEFYDGRTTVGLKMRPYPGVSVDYASQEIDAGKRADLYKLSYFLPF